MYKYRTNLLSMWDANLNFLIVFKKIRCKKGIEKC